MLRIEEEEKNAFLNNIMNFLLNFNIYYYSHLLRIISFVTMILLLRN